MIDFGEITWEKFEDLALSLLEAEGLKTRRLGRGPGQTGKDIIALEYLGGPLSKSEIRKWLVECKFTSTDGSIGEDVIFNIYDRVKSQDAYGYLLFTTARLRVNLEKTMHGLCNKIGIDIWDVHKIFKKVVLNNNIFKTFFPNSFNKWLQDNRLIYLSQMSLYRSPLGHIFTFLQFLRDAPVAIITEQKYRSVLDELIPILRNIIDNMDEQLTIIKLRDT